MDKNLRILAMAGVTATFLMGTSASVATAQVHNAHWYRQEAASGSHSVILNLVDGNDAIVAVVREKGVNEAVAGIGTDLSFRRKVLSCAPPACWPPSVLLGIDKNMNGRYEADDFAWQWSLAESGGVAADPALLHGDTFLQCENPMSLLGPDPAFVAVNAHSEYFCFHPRGDGTGYALNYAPLSSYQLGLGTLDGITSASSVLALKVLAGGSGSWMDFSALVDVVTMGAMMVPTTRIDDPRNSRSHFEIVTSK